MRNHSQEQCRPRRFLKIELLPTVIPFFLFYHFSLLCFAVFLDKFLTIPYDSLFRVCIDSAIYTSCNDQRFRNCYQGPAALESHLASDIPSKQFIHRQVARSPGRDHLLLCLIGPLEARTHKQLFYSHLRLSIKTTAPSFKDVSDNRFAHCHLLAYERVNLHSDFGLFSRFLPSAGLHENQRSEASANDVRLLRVKPSCSSVTSLSPRGTLLFSCNSNLSLIIYNISPRHLVNYYRFKSGMTGP